MDLRRLRYFLAVAEERNFRRAAERLNMSQPPLSQQIQLLEAELGATLFVRNRRSVELTDAGEILLRRARAILASAQEAAVEIEQVGRGQLGKLVIGFMSAAMLTRLTGILAAFRPMRPAVDVQLRQLPPREQIAAVAAGHVDVGFLSIAPPHRNIEVGDVEIAAEPLWIEELVLAVPHGHLLADSQDLSVRSLGAETFISLPQAPETGYYDRLVELCRNTGAFRPTIRQEVEHLPDALALIAAGYGVALMPVCVMESWSKLVSFRRLAERPTIAVTMIRRQDNHSPVLDAFLKIMRPQLAPLYSAQTAFEVIRPSSPATS